MVGDRAPRTAAGRAVNRAGVPVTRGQARLVLAVGLVAVLQLAGCAAMMMDGDGGYRPPSETCSADQRRAGLCKAP